MKLSPFKLFAASLAVASVALGGCAMNPSSGSEDDDVDVETADSELHSLRGKLAGEYAWDAVASGGFVDFETLDLRANGTYSAMVDATLVNPAVRCFRFPCTLPESGHWSAYRIFGKTRIRLHPSRRRTRTYGASVAAGQLTLSRYGETTVLFSSAAPPPPPPPPPPPELTCASVLCIVGTVCEMRPDANGTLVPECVGTPPPPPPPSDCVKTGCSGHICAEQEMFTTCEYRPEYACYQDAVCERQASGQCGFTATPTLTACLANP